MSLHGKTNRSCDSNLHLINVTPIIDVSLTLVVMLLLATPLGLESSIAVKKAMERAKAAEEKKVEERIDLFVLSEDTISVNHRIVAREHLSENLRPLIESSTSRMVVIDCNGTVSHGAFVDVLDQTKICGAMEIAIMGR